MIGRGWEHLNAHPRTRDAVVAGIWLLIGLAALQLAGIRLWADFALFHTDGTVYLVALLAIAAVALMRSTRPFLALGLGTGIAAVDLAFGGSLGVVLILSDLIYAAVKYGSDRGLRIALWAALITAVLSAVSLLIVSPHSATVPTVAVQLALIIFVSAAWGWAVRSERSRTRVALMQAHAQQTSEMRERIAHDLHDLVANQIAVAGLHIEAAKLRVERGGKDPDPDRADQPAAAAAVLASLGRAKQGTDAAHRELRALIEVLTATLDLENPGTEALRHVGVSGAGELSGNRQAAAELSSLASLVPDGRSLRWQPGAFDTAVAWVTAAPAATQTAALRVMRELVANAAKHGTDDVELRVDATPSATRVTVTNRVAEPSRTVPGTQLGLRSGGMILGMVGGALDSRLGERSTWLAVMTLPSTMHTEEHA